MICLIFMSLLIDLSKFCFLPYYFELVYPNFNSINKENHFLVNFNFCFKINHFTLLSHFPVSNQNQDQIFQTTKLQFNFVVKIFIIHYFNSFLSIDCLEQSAFSHINLNEPLLNQYFLKIESQMTLKSLHLASMPHLNFMEHNSNSILEFD